MLPVIPFKLNTNQMFILLLMCKVLAKGNNLRTCSLLSFQGDEFRTENATTVDGSIEFIKILI